MPLLRVDQVGLAYGHHVLLEDASCQLFKGDRVCLVGRNGAGKSTFMKLAEGLIKPDSGTVWFRPGINIARLEQELPSADERTVLEVVSSGLEDIQKKIDAFNELSSGDMNEDDLKKLAHIQHELEACDGWNIDQKIDEVITRLSLPKHKKMSELSGGWRRRVSLGQALVSNPDILLLDEPTNHLDVQAIEWLENQLLAFSGAILFVTHDRSLVRRLATKIIELDRGTLRAFNCGYDNFLEEKAHLLEVEDQQNALFDKKLAQEEVWIRQGIKARRTRNEGRVRALKKLREERSQRREQTGNANIVIEQSGTSGKLVAELEQASFMFDENPIFKNLNLKVIRGDKIGLIGPNGVGKTTLLKVLLGDLEPTSGSIKLGTKLDVAYYDQMRSQLDDNKTIVDTVGQGRESISINGKDRHIMSYLGDFLFSPERARTPLKALSGGERNRVQLACLFSQPANILVMDEPTNDLDVETLELLESVLVEFSGTLLLVSHDREFMDNVVSSTLVFNGNGRVDEYVGGYHDWLRQSGGFIKEETPVEKVKEEPAPAVAKTKAKKLSYKLQRELDELPDLIERLEGEQEALQQEAADPAFYQQDQASVSQKLEQLAKVDEQLQTAYDRWVELSED